ncbi:MAG: aspartate 1-decarboxylase [Actinomycetota bacterium]|jgi:aspartate 1-decarboxylase|nr:aspartate 1-decarboxylase [Actinomycetota bacterium]
MNYITMLKGKLHRVKVTATELNYEGSCAIDSGLLKLSEIRPHEQIHIYNINNGERFITYAIEAPPGSGTISLNGAAARLAAVGDLLIIAAFAQVPEESADDFHPLVTYVDENNQPLTK